MQHLQDQVYDQHNVSNNDYIKLNEEEKHLQQFHNCPKAIVPTKQKSRALKNLTFESPGIIN